MTGDRAITRRQLRLWGLQTGGALLALGSIVHLWRGHAWGAVPLILGGAFLLLGLAAVAPARAVYVGWHRLIGAILWAWTKLALTLTFLLAVVPLALLGRLIGRDRMRLRFPGGEESYWRKEEPRGGPDRYRRQF